MSKRKSETDAITLLEEDHKRVQEMFKTAEKLGEEDIDELQEIVETACMELTVHSQVEEELVYPAFREALEDEQDLILEAEVEHQSATDLIAQLEEMDPSDERYKPTFTVLGEYVNHHIKEEEKEMFPKARKAGLDLESLGQQVMARKAELEAELSGADADEETTQSTPAAQ
jgi:hemerythrin superfamily protein